ncbi:MAG TPA: hypothetical protein ENN81_12680 [Phycisphaerales bacterium]|nr:hypothetical protein [Phycisphaerales bacterium]
MSNADSNVCSAGRVGAEEFKQLVEQRAGQLLSLVDFVSRHGMREVVLSRPLLGELHSQAMQIEELLDAYDAGNNCSWCWFRSLTAALKLFSDVTYELLHIQHSVPDYRLMPIENDFAKATDQVLGFTCDVLVHACRLMEVRSRQLGLAIVPNGHEIGKYAEKLPGGRLPRDCRARRVETVAETVTGLATAFLNLAADSEDIRGAGRAKPDQYARYLEGPVTEDKLRSLELRFHNLQSLYDTKVSGTEIAAMDTDLPVLRGHISVVFHLLKTATLFAHHYERHLDRKPCEIASSREPLVNRDALLAALMSYSIRHISLYIACTEQLCQDMLKRYAEVAEVTVPVPPYRGFHVRPSTLISKLVLHYGSEVRMLMDNEVYDAGSPLELFRANEKINAAKRRRLAEAVDGLNLNGECLGSAEIKKILHETVMQLVQREKVILYEQPLELPAESVQTLGRLQEQVTVEVARLLTLGKIDVEVDLQVRFVGDRRVLDDIRLLAESGYGEDHLGNNIALPQKLVYLRR